MNLLQRKYLSLFIIFGLACNGVLAETIKDMDASFKTIPQGEYKHKTVKKHYRMYDVRIKNNGKKPVLLSSSSEVIFVSTLGQQEVSPSRRTIYRKSRKRDIGRYYWFALPGAIIAGGITGITFFLGAPIGAAVYVGMYLPTDKAVRNNVRLQEPPLMMLKIISGILMALAYGAIGFLDDYVKVVKKRNLGLTAMQKLIMQFLVAGIYLLLLYFAESMQKGNSVTSTIVPFFGRINLGIFYWPIAAVLIVGMVNAVNLTDGIDGLCTSITFFVSIFFMLIASFFCMINLSIVAGALLGGCFGFLMFNIHPAQVFMGDTGSLFLGGLICAIAFTINMPILLPIIGAMYVVEMFSVILQVIYFKATKGKRLFKMSPLHHHFEMCGWSEIKICIVFDMVTIIFGVIAIASIIFGL